MTRRAAPGGVAYSSDCYRTYKGVRYEAYASDDVARRAKLYRSYGVRCRSYADELFMHPEDLTKASAIDAANIQCDGCWGECGKCYLEEIDKQGAQGGVK